MKTNLTILTIPLKNIAQIYYKILYSKMYLPANFLIFDTLTFFNNLNE